MKAVITPALPCGTIDAPPSKSYAHRHLICAMLAGEGKVCNVDLSDDIRATLRCMSSLGAKYEYDNHVITVTRGISKDLDSACLDVNESGTTLRFFIPICLAKGGRYVFRGAKRLFERPLDPYKDLCERRGIGFELGDGTLSVNGILRGGNIAVNGSQSSQFTGGLLLSSVLMQEQLNLAVTGNIESKPYIDMTIAALKNHGATITRSGNIISVAKGPFLPVTEIVEGDWSNAAYLYAFTFAGGNVKVNGLREDSLQGDKVCLKHFMELMSSSPLIDVADCPDLFPALAAVAALNNGAEFTHTSRLRLKESDRVKAMASVLEAFGAYCEVYDDNFIVERSELTSPTFPLDCFNDHRIVMALTVLMSVHGGTILNADAVNKSFPNYFKVFKSLGGQVELYDD